MLKAILTAWFLLIQCHYEAYLTDHIYLIFDHNNLKQCHIAKCM